MVNRDRFDLENDELLKGLLDVRYFQGFKEPLGGPSKRSCQLELFITDRCNLKCSYCYLNKYGSKLYPKNGDNIGEIIKNLRILFDNFLSEGYSFQNIDLFSGEIWGGELGNGVLDTIIEYVSRGLMINGITVPSNFSFILDDKKTSLLEGYIKKLGDVGCKLIFSASIDGKYLEDVTRPFRVVDSDGVVKVRDDEFYEKFFDFCHKHNFCFHPMVAAYGIENWIDNYKWYKENVCKRWGNEGGRIMMLEVRNDDWDFEKIQSFIKFLDFLIEDKFNDLGRDVSRFTKFLFNLDESSSSGYLPYCLPVVENHMPCTIQGQMCIRLGDLAIVGCHRMAYDKFVFGRYKVEDNKIVDIEANNPQVATKVMLCNPNNSIHGCDRCKYKKICMKGCFGSQYESTNELFMPIECVCDMFRTKYDFLLNKYKKMGVWDEAEKLLSEGLTYYNIRDYYDTYMEILNESGDSQC